MTGFIDLFSSNDIEEVNPPAGRAGTAFSPTKKGRDTAFLTIFGKEKARKDVRLLYFFSFNLSSNTLIRCKSSTIFCITGSETCA